MAFDEFVSKYESDISALAAKDNNEENNEYYQFLYLMDMLAKEMSQEVPLLFKEYEYNLIHPDYDDLRVILQSSKNISTDEYNEDDFLGWIYQYWVDTDEIELKSSEANKDISYASNLFNKVLILLDAEQTEYGEFYTPRWVVKYIVDNTIKEYRDQNDGPIEEIKILDPACGAGNFLVYAFDAIINIYNEEHSDWPTKKIIESVLSHNLYGADIQREPLQITALNLWIKAKTFAVNANISTLNLYKVNVLRANSLYKWEKEEEYHQISIFDTPETIAEKKYTSEDIGKLLSNRIYEDHNSAVKFFKEKFEIIIMNPPFVDTRKMNAETKEFLAKYYPDNSRNLFSAFIQRAFELSKKSGVIGFVSSDTWMAITSFEKIRNLIIDNSTITKCMHLGFGVFDGVDVSGVVFLLNRNKRVRENSIFYDVRNTDNKCEEDSIQYVFNQKSFRNIEGTPFIYELTTNLKKAFEKAESLGSGKVADIYSGLQVKMDNGYVFKKWEVPDEKKYVSFAYDCVGKYSSELNYVIDWSEKSVDRLKKESKEKGYHHSVLISGNADKYLFRNGILYSAGGSRFYSRIMDSNTIFYVGESAIFINDDTIQPEYVLGLMNSRLIDYILNLLNPSKNFQVGDISRVPFIVPNDVDKKNVVGLVKEIIDLQNKIFSFTYQSSQYGNDEISYGILHGAKDIRTAYEFYIEEYERIEKQLEALQDEIDEIIFKIYNLSENDEALICERFSNNINQFNHATTLEEASIRYLRNIVKKTINKSKRLYAEDDIINVIEKYFDIEFGKSEGYKYIEECEKILGQSMIECIRNGAKSGSRTIIFSGDLVSMEEPYLVSHKLHGKGKNKISVFWYRQDFLVEFEEDSKYAMQNEIRRLTNEVYLPKLQRMKEKLQADSLSKGEQKKVEKEIVVYEECVKTLENWKVVD